MEILFKQTSSFTPPTSLPLTPFYSSFTPTLHPLLHPFTPLFTTPLHHLLFPFIPPLPLTHLNTPFLLQLCTPLTPCFTPLVTYHFSYPFHNLAPLTTSFTTPFTTTFTPFLYIQQLLTRPAPYMGLCMFLSVYLTDFCIFRYLV